jgi:hypothetical protein
MRKNLIVGLLAFCVPAFADYQAYNLPNTPISGNQAWTGPLGMDFSVNQTIEVTALGAFVNAGYDVPLVPLTVQLFSLNEPPTDPSGPTLTSGSPVAGGGPLTIDAGTDASLSQSTWLFSTLSSPVFLQPGYCMIAARGYGPSRNFQLEKAPEPSAFAILGTNLLGLAALATVARRRRAD